MALSKTNVEFFLKNGYLLMDELFEEKEIELIVDQLPSIFADKDERTILEKNGEIRSVFCPNWTNEVMKKVTEIRRLVEAAQQLLNNDVYYHHTKINIKAAFKGDFWDWHQDYIYWKKEDGLPDSNILTAAIFLQDINEFNGPLFLIPGSHLHGVMDEDKKNFNLSNSPDQTNYDYMNTLTADLKYTLKKETLTNFVDKNGLFSAKGKKGSVLFFHGNLFHASANNLSPWPRNLFLITYNSIKNVPPEGHEFKRPSFLANRDFTPIKYLDDNVLEEHLSNVKS